MSVVGLELGGVEQDAGRVVVEALLGERQRQAVVALDEGGVLLDARGGVLARSLPLLQREEARAAQLIEWSVSE